MESNNSVSSRKPPVDKSIGALPPAIAVSQAACKNSSLVSAKALALELINSGSSNTNVAVGKYCVSGPSFFASTGARDSIPAAGMPSDIFVSISLSPGNSEAISLALEATAGVINISLAGYSSIVDKEVAIDRWSATWNSRMSSSSSPKNSRRTACSAVVGKTSKIPPLIANSPRLVTMSTRS